jgi:trimeric autotransporter adhesin
MKTKIILFVAFATVLANSCIAQFVTLGTATSSNLWSGGAVGIGYTTLPTFGTNKFQVSGNSLFTGNSQVTGFTGLGISPSTTFRLAVLGNSYFNGNVGIGSTVAATTRLEITATANDSGLRLATLPNTATVSTANNGKFLAVDNLGKVILVAGASSWNVSGNAGTVAGTNFMGTTDNVDLVFKRNAIKSGLLATTNTTFGVNSGGVFTTGLRNTFVGIDSGKLITSGNANLYLGDNAGSASITNNVNVYLGADAGRNATGNANTFVGYDSGGGAYTNASGARNIGIGVNSNYVPLGSDNILIGINTSTSNTSGTTPVFGNGNTFIGNNISNATVSNTVIIGDGSGNQRLVIDDLGATTITALAGTNTGKVLTADATGKLLLVANTGDANLYTANGALAGDRTVDLASHNLIFTNGTSTTNGKIYIGSQTPSLPTTTGNYKLYVEGGILTEKVRVALRNDPTFWADYVFANDYKLAPLNEVEKYYTANKHLPNIPSSQELLQSGLDLAAMQAKQMEKIEELTLYIVAQNKAIEDLKLQVETLLKK